MHQIDEYTVERKMYQCLRIVVAMCFIGHGAFGIMTKPIWCNYFAVFGIGSGLAYRLMPFVGAFDILLGILMLVRPMRIILLWLVGWGLLTASLRPLSGEPFPELIERAGNFGAPLALLLLCGGFKDISHKLFTRMDSRISPTTASPGNVMVCLRILGFLLLTGHGWLNLLEKKSLVNQYAGLGFPNPANTAIAIGLFELTAAVAVLIRPFRPLLFILLLWKTGSELFYPHYGLFEWIERGGSYGVLLTLWFAAELKPLSKTKTLFRSDGLTVPV